MGNWGGVQKRVPLGWRGLGEGGKGGLGRGGGGGGGGKGGLGRGGGGGGGGGEAYVTSHVVPLEHIVVFKEYLTIEAQKTVLDEALGAGL